MYRNGNETGNLWVYEIYLLCRKGNETGNLWGYEMTGDWTDASGWKRISLASGKFKLFSFKENVQENRDKAKVSII